ncbi:MAG TPA: glycosyltransferase family 2 protein [Diaminobutyricibacter sp.]
MMVPIGLTVVAVMTVLTILRNGAYWLRMLRQPTRITRERAEVQRAASETDPRTFDLHYVIPAFQERDALPETFRALQRAIEHASYHATITIVTSVHDEPQHAGERRTRQVAEELCAGIEYARVLLDQSAVPSMAAAFNTGTRDIAARTTRSSSSVYVAAYNADSSAAEDSVQTLGDTIIARDFPEVLQINFASMRNTAGMTGLGGWYARGAAYYQSRWAFGFEFDLHRRNSVLVRRGRLGHSYHLKGHGAVLRMDTALAFGGFSTQTPCEDLELGFRLALHGIPVHSVPVLEDTESPSTAAAVTKQKRYWFSGMIDVLHFHRLHPELRRADPVRFELARLASLYRSAACFLLAPVPYWVLFIGAVVLQQPLFAVPPVLNAVLSTWLIRRSMRRLAPQVRLVSGIIAIADVGAVLIWSMTRNIGPIQYGVAMARQGDRVSRMRQAHVAHIDGSAAARG